MIPRTDAELREYNARLAKLKAGANVRTHRLGDPDEVAGQDRRQARQVASPRLQGGTNGGKAKPNPNAPHSAPIAAATALLVGVKAGKASKRSKHGAVKVYLPGGKEKFDSKLEYRVWLDLVQRQALGEIRNLTRQVAYSLFGPRGHHIGKYVADFEYEQKIQLNAWRWVTADAKSAHTRKLPGWNRTKTLMYACHSIKVLELP